MHKQSPENNNEKEEHSQQNHGLSHACDAQNPSAGATPSPAETLYAQLQSAPTLAGQMLISAILAQNIPMLRSLIDVKADLEATDYMGRTPLSIAATNNYFEITQALIDAKAELEAKDGNNRTPLFITVYNNYPEITQALIDAKADLEAKDGNNRTPLLITVDNNYPEITQALIDAKANIEATDRSGRTPLWIAASENHPEIVEMMIDAKANLEATDWNGRTPLSIAATNNYFEITQALIDAKADLEAKDGNGRTPLSIAASNNYFEITQALIDAKANIEATDRNGRTPLWIAVAKDHPTIAQKLIDAKANLKATDSENRTLLSIATTTNTRPEITQALIKAGADLGSSSDLQRLLSIYIRSPKRWETIIPQLLLMITVADLDTKIKNWPRRCRSDYPSDHDYYQEWKVWQSPTSPRDFIEVCLLEDIEFNLDCRISGKFLYISNLLIPILKIMVVHFGDDCMRGLTNQEIPADDQNAWKTQHLESLNKAMWTNDPTRLWLNALFPIPVHNIIMDYMKNDIPRYTETAPEYFLKAPVRQFSLFSTKPSILRIRIKERTDVLRPSTQEERRLFQALREKNLLIGPVLLQHLSIQLAVLENSQPKIRLPAEKAPVIRFLFNTLAYLYTQNKAALYDLNQHSHTLIHQQVSAHLLAWTMRESINVNQEITTGTRYGATVSELEGAASHLKDSKAREPAHQASLETLKALCDYRLEALQDLNTSETEQNQCQIM